MPTNLSDPYQAREHARAQSGTVVPNMPTLPVERATNLPEGIDRAALVWDETLGAGDYCARVLKRHTRLRLINFEADACAHFIVFNADRPIERLNVADTVKVQWNAYLKQNALLLSDMGRVLMSLTRDTSGRHDTFCGPSNAKTNAAKYGAGENFSPFPNARDRFLIALQKFGLGKRDIPSSLCFFKGVKIEPDGTTMLSDYAGKPGDYVELRAEMNVLVVIANCPHVLDPSPEYVATPVRVLAYRGEPTPADDPIRNGLPEALRAFQNVEDYFLS